MNDLNDLLTKPLLSIGDTPISATTVATVFVVLVVTWQISRMLRAALKRALTSRDVVDPGTLHLLDRAVHYGVLLVGVGMSMETVGISLSTLFAAGAVFAVGFGFAMQTIAQNFVSGVILMVERTVRAGDVIRLGGDLFRVEDMGIRTTVVRAKDGSAVIIPNSVIADSQVRNYSTGSGATRLIVRVGVSYGSDMQLVRSVLQRLAAEQEWTIPESETQVELVDFGASSVDWEIRVWIDNPWTIPFSTNHLREQVWHAFAQEGIEIAFPQLDVHFDPETVQSLRPVG